MRPHRATSSQRPWRGGGRWRGGGARSAQWSFRRLRSDATRRLPTACAVADVPRHHTVRLAEQLSSFPLLTKWAVLQFGKRPGQPERPAAVIEPKPPNHELQPAEIKGLVADCQAGGSIEGLGRKYDLHEQTVRAHLGRQHVELRPAAALDYRLTPRIIEQSSSVALSITKRRVTAPGCKRVRHPVWVRLGGYT